ncbi:MAG: hypothetical protein QUV20_13975 [Oceanibaculum nanhaiense]|uniref:hypothetical protein n=1 Tax=Oceanibaculum nanhaiense TaxID=1909734 RepID=UPI0025A49294|nr:hypothetical protein [Oceanibaculum nanhaiense]MDM7947431.1 hypothetical protein [Oceanibaculum nanhaiense]
MLTGWLLAAILCGSALAQNAEQPAISPQAAETDSGQGDNAEDLLTTLKGIEAAVQDQAVTEDIDAIKRRELREEADLAAQQEMSKYTMDMSKAAWWAVGISGITTLLLIITIYYTREAANYAKDAAEAAQKSVEITEISAKQQIRAYVNVVETII